jgi:hypothetical protein
MAASRKYTVGSDRYIEYVENAMARRGWDNWVYDPEVHGSSTRLHDRLYSEATGSHSSGRGAIEERPQSRHERDRDDYDDLYYQKPLSYNTQSSSHGYHHPAPPGGYYESPPTQRQPFAPQRDTYSGQQSYGENQGSYGGRTMTREEWIRSQYKHGSGSWK